MAPCGSLPCEARIFGENVGPIDADAEGNFWVGLDKDSGKWKSGRPQSFEVPGLDAFATGACRARTIRVSDCQ